MSRIEFKTRNIAFGKFLERELKMQSVRSCEFERACGISKDALNRIKKA